VPIHQQWHGFLFIYFTLKLFIVVEAYNRAYTDPHKPLAAYAAIHLFSEQPRLLLLLPHMTGVNQKRIPMPVAGQG